jgi:hypothetical protein
VVPVRREVDVVNPDLRSRLDTESVTNISDDLGDLDVADDNIALVKHTQTNTVEGCEVKSNIASSNNCDGPTRAGFSNN